MDAKAIVDNCTAYAQDHTNVLIAASILSNVTGIPVEWCTAEIACFGNLSNLTSESSEPNLLISYLISIPTDADINITSNSSSNISDVPNVDDFKRAQLRDITLGIAETLAGLTTSDFESAIPEGIQLVEVKEPMIVVVSSSTSTSTSLTTVTSSSSTSTTVTSSSSTSTTVSYLVSCDSADMASGTYSGSLTCPAVVVPGTTCEASGCPEGSSPAGTSVCFATGAMIGWTYCLEDGTDSVTVGMVAGTLDFLLMAADPAMRPLAVDAELISTTVKSALLTIFRITEEEVYQYVSHVTNFTASDNRTGLPFVRRLTSAPNNTDLYQVSIVYQLVDRSGTNLDAWRTVASDIGTATSGTHLTLVTLLAFDIGLAELTSSGEVETLTLTSGVDSAGSLLVFDYDSNGIVNDIDNAYTLPTTTTEMVDSTTTNASEEDDAVAAHSDEGTDLTMLITIAALGLLVLVCCPCTYAAYVCILKGYA